MREKLVGEGVLGFRKIFPMLSIENMLLSSRYLNWEFGQFLACDGPQLGWYTQAKFVDDGSYLGVQYLPEKPWALSREVSQAGLLHRDVLPFASCFQPRNPGSLLSTKPSRAVETGGQLSAVHHSCRLGTAA